MFQGCFVFEILLVHVTHRCYPSRRRACFGLKNICLPINLFTFNFWFYIQMGFDTIEINQVIICRGRRKSISGQKKEIGHFDQLFLNKFLDEKMEKFQPSGAGGTCLQPAKSKIAARGPQNGR